MDDVTDDALLEELASLLGRALLTGAGAAPHEVPWRGPAGRALAIALPSDLSEVRSVVHWARRTRTRLLPQGAVTGLVGASTPPPRGPRPVVLSTDALNARTEVREADAVAVVDAGVRLSALNAEAARIGLELPVDLAADPSVGAMVATNTGGSRVMAHGDMSHHVLGVQAVIADETASVIGNLRGLRKDNTGPDPTRLLIGSAGALGVITAVAVALSPIPAERSTVLVGPIPDTAAVDLLTALRQAMGGRLSAFEVMCPAAVAAGVERARMSGDVTVGQDPDVLVLVEASGPAGCGDDLVEAVASVNLPDTSRTDAAATPGSGVPGAVVPHAEAWGLRHGITEGLRSRGEVLGFDLSVRPSDLPALRAGVRELVASRNPALTVADFGHWGDGGIHANVLIPAGAGFSSADTESLRHDVYELVGDRFGGSWSAEHGIGPLNADQWRATTPSAEVSLLTAAKDAADPRRILGHPGLPFG